MWDKKTNEIEGSMLNLMDITTLCKKKKGGVFQSFEKTKKKARFFFSLKKSKVDIIQC